MLDPVDDRRHRNTLRGWIATASKDDPEHFAQVVTMLDEARAELVEAAESLRTEGYSWADLAAPLGVTRSAVQQRFGRKAATPA